MKRLLAGAAGLALVGGAFVMPNATAEPSDACGGAPVATTDSSVSVCITEGPVNGSGTAAQEGSGGYIVADGDSTNEAPLNGYIGVQVDPDGGQTGQVGTTCDDPYAYPAEASTPESTLEFIQSGGASDCG